MTADWKEGLDVGFSFPELREKSALRLAEVQRRWRNREAKDFDKEYDLEARVRLAWNTRREIAHRMAAHELVKTHHPDTTINVHAYQMFLSRPISSPHKEQIENAASLICKELSIGYTGSGGGEVREAEFPLDDVRKKMRRCETFLAVIAERTDQKSNYWIEAEVAMALAFKLPVAIIVVDKAITTDFSRLGASIVTHEASADEIALKITAAVRHLDETLLKQIELRE